jgi:hypothetical protein
MRQGTAMKKLIYSMILTGALISSFVIVTSFGCGSSDDIGKGGNGGGGSTGGPFIKLDGSISNNGGSGGGGTIKPPTDDANCGSQTSSTTKEPPNVVLVLDRSSSMAWSLSEDNCFCSDEDIAFSGAGSGTLCASDCSSRWSAVKPAVIDTVSNTKDVNWGLKFFSTPNPDPNAAQCKVSADMEVQIGTDSAAAVKSQVDSATLSLSTPTAAAIKAAMDYLKTVKDNRPKFILLATDGEPNCGGTMPSISVDDINGATKAAENANKAGIPVYVIGIGPNPGNLSKLAVAGGTNDYYPVTSPEQLVKAFADISKLVASCTFTLTTKPQDLNNVAVYLDKNLVQKNDSDGWSFGGNNTTIVLNGDTCDKVTSGKATTVQLIFGCASPPLIIP